MLLLPLAHTDTIASLHPRFAAGIAWLRTAPLTTIAAGRHDISGDELFVIIEDGIGHDPATRRFESHREHIDLQYSISGGERMDVTSLSAGLTVVEPFQPGSDIAFYADPARPVTTLTVLPGELAIFFPDDAHKPSLRLGTPATAFRKAVVKVRISCTVPVQKPFEPSHSAG